MSYIFKENSQDMNFELLLLLALHILARNIPVSFSHDLKDPKEDSSHPQETKIHF